MIQGLLLFLFGMMYMVHSENILQIVAGGSTLAAPLYDALSFVFSSEYPQYSLSYARLGSSSGKCILMDFVAEKCQKNDTVLPRNLDWAGSDSIHAAKDYTKYKDIQMFPAFAGAVVAIYNIEGVDDLILPAKLLGDIFRQCDPLTTCPPGDVVYWNDSQILQANPDASVEALSRAGKIILIVRAEGSGTTEIFRQGLSLYNSNFALQFASVANRSDQPIWPNTTIRFALNNRGVASAVLNTKNSISYVSLDEAITSGNKYAGIGPSVLAEDGVLRANVKSVGYALVENGFNFGNNGDNPRHLTATVGGSKGSESWPLTGYTYFSVRLNTTYTGSSCDRRKAVMQWFQWFYESPIVDQVANSLSFGTLPAEGKEFILNEIKTRFRCQQKLEFTNNFDFPVQGTASRRLVPVNFHVAPELVPLIHLYQNAYQNGPSDKANIIVASYSGNDVILPPQSRPDVYVLDRFALVVKQPQFPSSQLLLPFAGVPWGITYNFCNVTEISCAYSKFNLILSLETIVEILAGGITMWNDVRLQALQEVVLNGPPLPNQPIQIVSYKPSSRELLVFSQLLSDRGYQMNLETISSVFLADSAEEASRLVAATTNSFTFGPLNMYVDDVVSKSAKLSVNGVIVSGDSSGINSCFLEDQKLIFNQYQFTKSNKSTCWPLADTYFMTLNADLNNTDCLSQVAQETIFFTKFLLTSSELPGVSDPLQLVGMSFLEQNSTEELINSITCFGRSITAAVVDRNLIPTGLIWTVRVGVIIFVVIIVGLMIWIRLKQSHVVLRAASPLFLWQMCIGFLFELVAILPLTMQEGEIPASSTEAELVYLNVACMAAPWFYFLGFTIVYSSLLVKTWRIHKIFHNPGMKRYHLSAWNLLRIEMVFISPLILVLILWTVMDPYHWTRSVSSVDPATGKDVASIGQCYSFNLTAYVVPIVLIIFCYLAAGLVLAWKNRSTPSEFSEGRYISAAILADAELYIVAVPVLVLSSSNSIAAFIVKVLFIFVSVGATVVIFFYPKYAIIQGYWATESDSSRGVRPEKGPRIQPPTPTNRNGGRAPLADQARGSIIKQDSMGSEFGETWQTFQVTNKSEAD